MSILEATVSMLETLPEDDVNTIYEVTKRFFVNRGNDNPYKLKSVDEIINELDAARENAKNGKFSDAGEVSRELRAKYGL